MPNNNDYEYPKKLSAALDEITKLPALSSGTFQEAAEKIVKIACEALDVSRVGICVTTGLSRILKNIACYDASAGFEVTQNDFDLDVLTEYSHSLESGRLIVTPNTKDSHELSGVMTHFEHKEVCAMIDAPIRVEGRLLGAVFFDQDCTEKYPKKREWTMDEQFFASSIADITATAIVKNSERRNSKLGELLYDTSPIPANFWSEDRRLIGCNPACYELFGVASKQDFIDNFDKFLPEYQPCGALSTDMAADALEKAFRDSYYRFEFTHIKLDGEALPLEVTLTKLILNDTYVISSYLKDLRQEKAAEKQMKELEQRSRLLYQTNPIPGSLWCRKEHKLIDCNQAMLNLFGFSSTEETSQRLLECMPPFQPCGTPSVEKFNTVQDEIVEKGQAHLRWLYVIPDTGEEVPCEITGVRIDDINGEPIMVAAYLNDLRGIEASIKKEQEAHELNRVILDNAPGAINLFSDKYELLRTSHRAAELFGLDSQQELVEKFSTLSPKYQPCGTLSTEKRIKYFEQAAAEGRISFEWMRRTGNGEELPMSVTLVRFSLGGKDMFVAYSLDISEIKASEERIRVMLDESPYAVTIFDTALNPIDCNMMSARMFGFNAVEEYLVKFIDYLPLIQPDGTNSKAHLNGLLTEAFETGKAKGELTVLKTDVTLMHTEVTYVRVPHGGGHIVIEYMRDLTETIAAKEAERENNEFIQMLLDAAPLLVEIWNEKGEIVNCNQHALDVVGVIDKHEFINRYTNFNPKYQPCGRLSADMEKEYLSIVKARGYHRYEWQSLSASGEELPLEMSTVHLFHQGKDFFVFYGRDLREIKEAEERSHIMLDATPTAVFLYDENYQAIDCNTKSLELFGFADKEEACKDFLKTLPKTQPNGDDSLAALNRLLDKTFKDGKVVSEFMLQNIDGTLIPALLTHVRVRHKDRYAVVEYSWDLTEVKAAQKQLTEMKERMQILYDANPIPASLWNSDKEIIECNEAMVKLFGMSSKEETLRRFFEFSPEYQHGGISTKDTVERMHQQVVKEGYGRQSWRHIIPDTGEIIPGVVTMVRIDTPDGDYLLAAYLHDLREIKAASEFREKLIDALPLLIEFWDEDLNLYDCNRQAIEMLGLSSKSEYIDRYFDFQPVYQPCDTLSRDKTETFVKKAMEEGAARSEWIMLRSDGEELPVESIFTRLDAQGKSTVAAFSFDMREIKQAAQKEREAHELNAAILNSSPFIINIWNEKRELAGTSHQVIEMFGLMEEQQYIDEFYNLSPYLQPCGTPSKEKASYYLEKAFVSGFERFEWLHQNLKGELIPTEIILSRFNHLGKNMLVAFTVDMREVSAANEKFKTFFEHAPMMIEIVDENLNFIDCNDYVRTLFGVKDKQEFIDGWDDLSPEYQPCGTNSREKFERLAEQALRKGFAQFDWLHLDANGNNLPVTTTYVRFMDRDKPIIVGYNQDLRQIKIAMEKEREAELAARESKAKTRFLAQISHEIRTPMNAILGIAEIQLQSKNLPLDLKDPLSRIRSSSYLLLAIINNLLDLSKAEADKLEIVDKPYELVSLIVDTVQLNMIYLGSKPIEIMINADPNLPFALVGDELRLKQILSNMLSNAFKYTTEGAVTVSFGIDKNMAEEGQAVLIIQIDDTGRGMAKSQIRRLFSEEYIRFNEKDTIEGSGLGMAITYRLLAMMNGTIEVDSEVGKGTSVKMYIPQKSVGSNIIGEEYAKKLQRFEFVQMASYQVADFIREPMPYGRVLVVDDVEINLYVSKGHFAPYKIKVDTAMSGFDAIDKIKSGKVYDIVFMDHMMPKMDGVETVKKLREDGYEGIVVALTANALVGNDEMFLQNGFDDFISKPVDIRELDEALNKYVRDRHPEEAEKYRNTALVEAAATGKANSGPDPELLRIFRRDALKAISTLHKTVAAGEMKLFTTTVHAMKSALANIGEIEFSWEAAELEDAARRIDMEYVDAYIGRFIQKLEVIVQRAEELDPDSQPRPERQSKVLSSSEDKKHMTEQLKIIRTACEHYDRETAVSNLDRLIGRTQAKDLDNLKEIRIALFLHSDFDYAIERIGAMLEEIGNV